MASFVHSLLRLVGYNTRSPRVRSDEEQATTAGSVMGSSTLAPSHIHTTTGHRVPSDDTLTLFRLMLGVTAAPHLGFSSSALRPADNVGLYARVVNSEQKAKDSYKVFSAVINACYFLQIIVAAALTALGAANADNKAITAFGAINTVIAGFLSYLKGSGYPARFKRHASEWKKVREFIEHRERDFSLEGCSLDVYEVVDAIREMYDNTKREIQMNVPESYNPNINIRYDGVDKSKAEAIAGKLRGLDEKVGRLKAHAGFVSGTGVDLKELKTDDVVGKLPGLDDTAQKLRSHVGSVSESVGSKSADVVSRLRSLEDTLENVKTRIERTVHRGQEAAHNTIRDAADHAADNITHVIQDEEKRVTGEFRNLGKTVSRELEERKPRLPREVSITVAHRDGNVASEAMFRK